MEYGSRKKGILHTNCTNPMLNVILCEMEEKDMSYTLLDRFEFFHVSNCIYLLISFFQKKNDVHTESIDTTLTYLLKFQGWIR